MKTVLIHWSTSRTSPLFRPTLEAVVVSESHALPALHATWPLIRRSSALSISLCVLSMLCECGGVDWMLLAQLSICVY